MLSGRVAVVVANDVDARRVDQHVFHRAKRDPKRIANADCRNIRRIGLVAIDLDAIGIGQDDSIANRRGDIGGIERATAVDLDIEIRRGCWCCNVGPLVPGNRRSIFKARTDDQSRIERIRLDKPSGGKEVHRQQRQRCGKAVVDNRNLRIADCE